MLKNGEIIKIKLFNLEFPRVHKTRVLKIVPFSLETEDQCDLSSDRESILLIILIKVTKLDQYPEHGLYL